MSRIATNEHIGAKRRAIGLIPLAKRRPPPLPTCLIPLGNGQNPYGQRPFQVPLCLRLGTPVSNFRYPYATFRGTPKGVVGVPPRDG